MEKFTFLLKQMKYENGWKRQDDKSQLCDSELRLQRGARDGAQIRGNSSCESVYGDLN